jgi:1-phosphofructokinase
VIITVTPNPSLDLTYSLLGALDEDVLRATSSTLEASGKGVNVSRALVRAGLPTSAVLPAGGATGRYLTELLRDEGVAFEATAQAGATRINTTVLRQGAPALKFNGPGEGLSASERTELLAATTRALDDARGEPFLWLAICGSLPRGVDGSLVSELVAVAQSYGASCAVDASGDALSAALSSGADLVAPNRRELAEVEAGIEPEGDDLEAFAQSARTLALARGTSLLISLGSEGALYADATHLVHGWAPPLSPVNPAGAGDALFAGWLSAEGDIPARLQRAITWGRSSCMAPTTVDPTPGRGDFTPITVRDLAPT